MTPPTLSTASESCEGVHQMFDITVVMLTYNQREVTLRCLSSLEDVEGDKISILVWDNGSTDGTEKAIKERFPHVEVRRSEQNIGAAGGRNEGAAVALDVFGPEFLLFLDNDTVVEPDFIRHLRKPFAGDPDVGMTTPKIRFLDEPQRIDSAGGCRVQFHLGQTPAVGAGEIDRGQYNVSRECIPGSCCMLVRASVFEEVGGFDTDFDPYGLEDLDFSLRVRQAGYKGIYAPDALIYHDQSQTYESGQYTSTYARTKAMNWYRFVQRHASPTQKAAFWLLGVPVRLLSAFRREIGHRNIGSVSGLLRGGWGVLTNKNESI